MTVSPGDTVVNLPKNGGGTVAVKVSTAVSPGDRVVLLPSGMGKIIAVKPGAVSPGDAVVFLPTRSGKPIAFASFDGGMNPPGTNFSATPVIGYICPKSTITFIDTSTGAPSSWLWDFGDGSTSTAQNPTHQYTTPGLFTVALTATNAYGSRTYTRYNYITISSLNLPVFDITLNDTPLVIDGYVPPYPDNRDGFYSAQGSSGVYVEVWYTAQYSTPIAALIQFRTQSNTSAQKIDFDAEYIGEQSIFNLVKVQGYRCSDGTGIVKDVYAGAGGHFQCDLGAPCYGIVFYCECDLFVDYPNHVSMAITNITFS